MNLVCPTGEIPQGLDDAVKVNVEGLEEGLPTVQRLHGLEGQEEQESRLSFRLGNRKSWEECPAGTAALGAWWNRMVLHIVSAALPTLWPSQHARSV